MGRRALLTLTVGMGLAALLLPAPVAAASHEEEAAPLPLLWISYVTAEPGQSDELTAAMGEQGKALYDGLVADGHAMNWGVAQAINHYPGDDWTHMEWVSFANWAGAGEFVNRFFAAQQAKSNEEKAAEAAEWDAMTVHGSHYDEILRFLHVAGPPDSRPAYVKVGYMGTQPWKRQGVAKIYKKWRSPMSDKLVESGDLLGHGVFEKVVHGPGTGWTHGAFELMSSLGGIDALDKAEEKYMASMTPEDRKEWMEAMSSTFDFSHHHDRILVVMHHSADSAASGDEGGAGDADDADNSDGGDG